jgi:hypothetical protein
MPGGQPKLGLGRFERLKAAEDLDWEELWVCNHSFFLPPWPLRAFPLLNPYIEFVLESSSFSCS